MWFPMLVRNNGLTDSGLEAAMRFYNNVMFSRWGHEYEEYLDGNS